MLLGSAGPGADGSTVTLISTTLSNNQALGGAGGAHNDGGNGYGGGLFVNDTCSATVDSSTIDFNSALGGSGGWGGAGGQGVGGGVYNEGTFNEYLSAIDFNFASYKFDNIFGSAKRRRERSP